MLTKNIFNMVMSIIFASIFSIFLVLIIIFKALKGDIIGIIFCSLSLVFGITSEIIKAVDEVNNNKVLNKLHNIFKITALTFFSIYLVLLLNTNIKWILLGITLVLSTLYIVFKSINKFKKLNELLHILILIITLVAGYLLYNFNYLFTMLLIGLVTYYLFNLKISNKNNKLINNKLIIFLLIFTYIDLGIFLILN